MLVLPGVSHRWLLIERATGAPSAGRNAPGKVLGRDGLPGRWERFEARNSQTSAAFLGSLGRTAVPEARCSGCKEEAARTKGSTVDNRCIRSEERRVGKECRSRWSP